MTKNWKINSIVSIFFRFIWIDSKKVLMYACNGIIYELCSYGIMTICCINPHTDKGG